MAATANTKEGKTRTLLGLPAELRNHIYRYALCEVDRIAISQDNFQQPGLLKTCRQTREECSAIYYQENLFKIPIDNFNASVALSWCQHAVAHSKKGSIDNTIDLQVGSSPSWANLMRWVKHCLGHRVFGLNQGENDSPRWNVTAGSFAISQKLKESGVEWAEIEEVLEVYKISTKYTVNWAD